MATLQDKVQAYIGTVSDTTSLTGWLVNGVHKIIDIMPLPRLTNYTTNLADSGSGININNYKVIRAHKLGYEAIGVPAGLKSAVIDSNSIYYATNRNPVYYEENGMGYIIPSGGTIIALQYPVVTYSTLSGSTQFLTDFETPIVLWASIQGAIQSYNTVMTSLSNLTLGTIADLPVTPIAPSFTWTDASIGTYSPTIIGSLGTAPTYTKPVTGAAFTNAGVYIDTDQDIELGKASLDIQNSLLNNYQLDIANELNEYNKELEIYKSTVEQVFKQAELTQQVVLQSAKDTTDLNLQNEIYSFNKQIEQYKSNLQLYSSQIESYGANTNKVIQEYSADINKYSQLLNSKIALIKMLKDEFAESIK